MRCCQVKWDFKVYNPNGQDRNRLTICGKEIIVASIKDSLHKSKLDMVLNAFRQMDYLLIRQPFGLYGNILSFYHRHGRQFMFVEPVESVNLCFGIRIIADAGFDVLVQHGIGEAQVVFVCFTAKAI